MKLKYIALFSLIFSGSLAAQDIEIVGTVTHSIKPLPAAHADADSSNINQLKSASDTLQVVKFLKVKLSDHAKQNLMIRAKNAAAHSNQFALKATRGNLPPSVQLGMNDVPVLNQGIHGTCVTFANTAAVDAVLGQGDYVSQLCQLQLGNYLAKNAYIPSGWDGSWGRTVLSQMDTFGIVGKAQEAQGCGGVTQYPVDAPSPESSMNPEEYRQLSEELNQKVLWSPVLDTYHALGDRVNTQKTLDEVKEILNAGDRLTFGVLLADLDLGVAGAVGKNKAQNDSWVLTPQIARDVYLHPQLGGHEMIITGYDDDAVAIDDNNQEHRGLLTIRNSWGPNIGDQGNFYMSYDYFKLLVAEVQRIRPVIAQQ